MVLTDCQILKTSQPKPPNQGEGFFQGTNVAVVARQKRGETEKSLAGPH